MRVAAAAVAVAALVMVASSVGAATPDTSLRVAYWDDGSGGAPDAVWTLRCNPARGTLARPVQACARLARGGAKLFAPISPKVACTEIYGGPQRAQVTGYVAGRRIWATFARTDGCQIARWDGLVPWLLPPGGVA